MKICLTDGLRNYGRLIIAVIVNNSDNKQGNG